MRIIRTRIVANCLARLREQKTHTLFAGYLYLQQRATQLSRLSDLQPDFLSFFKKFYFVGNHPLGTPYIKPFTEQKPSSKNLWLNENVAGSYAPSSLRPNQPFRKVVLIEGKTYSLPRDHATRAHQYLLYNKRIQVADLTTFLYRDFGFQDSLTINDLIDVFAYEFGYSNEPGAKINANFQKLFSRNTTKKWEANWLEEE